MNNYKEFIEAARCISRPRAPAEGLAYGSPLGSPKLPTAYKLLADAKNIIATLEDPFAISMRFGTLDQQPTTSDHAPGATPMT